MNIRKWIITILMTIFTLFNFHVIYRVGNDGPGDMGMLLFFPIFVFFGFLVAITYIYTLHKIWKGGTPYSIPFSFILFIIFSIVILLPGIKVFNGSPLIYNFFSNSAAYFKDLSFLLSPRPNISAVKNYGLSYSGEDKSTIEWEIYSNEDYLYGPPIPYNAIFHSRNGGFIEFSAVECGKRKFCLSMPGFDYSKKCFIEKPSESEYFFLKGLFENYGDFILNYSFQHPSLKFKLYNAIAWYKDLRPLIEYQYQFPLCK